MQTCSEIGTTSIGPLYLGVPSAIHPTAKGGPSGGGSTFAIVCIYLYVAFHSLVWGPYPIHSLIGMLTQSCSISRHGSSVNAAMALQFAIAKADSNNAGKHHLGQLPHLWHVLRLDGDLCRNFRAGDGKLSRLRRSIYWLRVRHLPSCVMHSRTLDPSISE